MQTFTERQVLLTQGDPQHALVLKNLYCRGQSDLWIVTLILFIVHSLCSHMALKAYSDSQGTCEVITASFKTLMCYVSAIIPILRDFLCSHVLGRL